jgi:hypothetical protein
MKRFFIVIPILLTLLASLSACTAPSTKPAQTKSLFSDDFSNTTSGWTVSNTVDGSIGYSADSYTFLVNNPGTLLLANPGKSFPGDISVEVDARKIAGPDDNYFGVLCHYRDPQNYYVLMITSDGYSGISMRKDGVDTLISPGLKFLKMDGIKKSASTNHIRADCVGEKLTLYANGKQVSLAYDKSLTGGDSGLAVRSGELAGGVNIRFDNFTISTPSQP